MMRVEVEVYKGPIGKSKESQIGELSALLAETVKAMNGWRRQALLVASDQVVSPRAAEPLHCASKVGDPDCAILDQAISAAAEVAAAICNIDPEGYRLEVYYRPASPADATGKTLDQAGAEQWSRMQYGDACEALIQGAQGNAYLADTRIDGPPAMGTIKSGFREYTRRVSTVASIMRAKAYRLVSANTGYVPKNQQVRYMSASGIFLQRLYERLGGAGHRYDKPVVLVVRLEALRPHDLEAFPNLLADPADAELVVRCDRVDLALQFGDGSGEFLVCGKQGGRFCFHRSDCVL